MTTKKFVKIQSNEDITVTSGLQYYDYTNPNAHIPDRLKISPAWNKCTCLIRKGQGTYPSEIAEWNTVKSLEKAGVLTLGGFVDEPLNEKDNEVKAKVEKAVKEFKNTEGVKNKFVLNDIVGD